MDKMMNKIEARTKNNWIIDIKSYRKKYQDSNDIRWNPELPNFEQPEKEVPCAMDRAFEEWKRKGNKGQFSVLLVCRCPKCRMSSGTL